MSNLILRDFRLTRDFRSVDWNATIRYNLMRACAAGFVLGPLIFWMSISSREMTGGHPAWPALAFPLILPLMYLVIFLPFGLLFGALGSVIPFIGLFTIFVALLVAIGDPIICILYAVAPKFVPVQRPSFFSLKLIYYVLKPEESAQVVISR
jgi:hypothetical protein